MKIRAIPDQDDTELDPVDPLGRMYFQDDEGRELSIGSTWFDERRNKSSNVTIAREANPTTSMISMPTDFRERQSR
jgi:hypothetical protein